MTSPKKTLHTLQGERSNTICITEH